MAVQGAPCWEASISDYPVARTFGHHPLASLAGAELNTADRQPQKKAPESTGAFHLSLVCARTAGLCKAALFVNGRRIAASLEHGAKMTPRQGKFAV